jgi:hypothetical protein
VLPFSLVDGFRGFDVGDDFGRCGEGWKEFSPKKSRQIRLKPDEANLKPSI